MHLEMSFAKLGQFCLGLNVVSGAFPVTLIVFASIEDPCMIHTLKVPNVTSRGNSIRYRHQNAGT